MSRQDHGEGAGVPSTFEPARLVATGPTTRVVELTTGEKVSFAPEALHDMLRQAREKFIPMNVEHLDLLPPIGRWDDGEVKVLADGELQLFLHGRMLHQFAAQGPVSDPFLVDGALPAEGPAQVQVTVTTEPRNFDADTWTDARGGCPYPVAETNKWSALPPLEWLLAIPVTWGAAKFAGSFLERLGADAAEALVGWIKATSRRAKEPERDHYVTLAFDLDDGRTVYGFVAVDEADEDQQATLLRAALDAAGGLAEVAGAQRDGIVARAHSIAYFYDGQNWQLGWFVNDEGVFRTEYFAEHAPDPERFLGRPLLPDGLPARHSIGGAEPIPDDE